MLGDGVEKVAEALREIDGDLELPDSLQLEYPAFSDVSTDGREKEGVKVVPSIELDFSVEDPDRDVVKMV